MIHQVIVLYGNRGKGTAVEAVILHQKLRFLFVTAEKGDVEADIIGQRAGQFCGKFLAGGGGIGRFGGGACAGICTEYGLHAVHIGFWHGPQGEGHGACRRIGAEQFLSLIHISRREKQLALESMEKMQISLLSKRCYRTLSGGQQQRVLLARALCAARKILLLDEPVSGLDPTAAAEMYSIVQKLNDRDGITVVMISHDISAALQYASHILHIGETTFFGTKAAYQAEFPPIWRKEGEVQ